MRDSLLYVTGENRGIIHEQSAPYIESLDKKITEYMQRLENFEARCNKSDANEEQLLAEIIMINDAMLHTCAQFEQHINDSHAIRTAQRYFREKTNQILSKSYCINRCRVWPRGQQGDFETIEIAYRNRPLSQGIGFYLDKYFLSLPIAIGIRERITTLRTILEEELKTRNTPKILNIGCGSCREVFDLAMEIQSSQAKYTCIDISPEALNFALDRFSSAGLLSDNVEFFTYNPLKLFDYEAAVRRIRNARYYLQYHLL
ncbi:MAG: class I SAM-dependent methyltransferase [Nitrospirota bacterium]